MKLVEPTLEHLPSYVDALRRGWSFDSHRPVDAIREELEEIDRDAAGFVARQVDPEAKGPPIVLPDGSRARRLPSYRFWMWDGEFCGAISLRWERGTHALPPTCLGHVGYGVVPWKRGRGYARAALGMLRERVRREGLTYADIVADVGNAISRKVIVASGGAAFLRFRAPEPCGGDECLRFRWYAAEPHPIERETVRLRLRQWREDDRAPFAALNADPAVMAHFPAMLSREQSDAAFDRLREAIASRGWGLWAAERREDGRFLGFVGLAPAPEDLPIAPAIEVGWRLAREAWGAGYASEAAHEALRIAFETLELPEVVSFTALPNRRSMAVMQRIGMREDGGFEHPRIPEGHALRPHRLFRISREEFLSRL
jgi:RimJ/RimL family protein N-acetyltransferase